MQLTSFCSSYLLYCFFYNDTATTEIYTLSLHDALPISDHCCFGPARTATTLRACHHLLDSRQMLGQALTSRMPLALTRRCRSEEHTSELQSLAYLVCRLLLEKKKYSNNDVN